MHEPELILSELPEALLIFTVQLVLLFENDYQLSPETELDVHDIDVVLSFL